jgi:hypothetical protein
MSMVPNFCGIDVTYEDVPCKNLFRERVIVCIYSALHKPAHGIPREIPVELLQHTRRSAGVALGGLGLGQSQWSAMLTKTTIFFGSLISDPGYWPLTTWPRISPPLFAAV